MLILLSSCTMCDEACQYENKARLDAEIQINLEREKTTQEERRKQIEVERAIELAKTPEQRQQEAALKIEQEKLDIQKKQLEAAEKQAKSLEYLEDSKQVHDTMEVIWVGLSIFDALSQ